MLIMIHVLVTFFHVCRNRLQHFQILGSYISSVLVVGMTIYITVLCCFICFCSLFIFCALCFGVKGNNLVLLQKTSQIRGSTVQLLYTYRFYSGIFHEDDFNVHIAAMLSHFFITYVEIHAFQKILRILTQKNSLLKLVK